MRRFKTAGLLNLLRRMKLQHVIKVLLVRTVLDLCGWLVFLASSGTVSAVVWLFASLSPLFFLTVWGIIECIKTALLQSHSFHLGEGTTKQHIFTTNIICYLFPLCSSWILHAHSYCQVLPILAPYAMNRAMQKENVKDERHRSINGAPSHW